jgi:hypothetical protein
MAARPIDYFLVVSTTTVVVSAGVITVVVSTGGGGGGVTTVVVSVSVVVSDESLQATRAPAITRIPKNFFIVLNLKFMQFKNCL